MNKYKIYMITSIFILIISLGGTLAWYVWTSTNNSSVSLAVCAPEISFIGGDTIDGTDLVPVTSKEQGLKKEINVFLNKTCKEGDSGVMNLYMKLDLLPKELQHETFIYEVIKDDKVLYSGNFKDNKEGDVIPLLTDQIITETSSIYNIYVYIDGTRDNPIGMSNKNFRFSVYGEGTGAIYRENVLTDKVSDNTYFLNTTIERSKIKTLTIADSNVVPEGITGIPVSSTGDNSIMLWYTDDDNDGILDVYMGGKNGIIKTNINGESMFKGLSNIESLDLSNLDTSNMTNMYAMFLNCSSLKELKISNFDTSKVKTMQIAFLGCSSLTNLDLNNFDTSNVTNMRDMFNSCTLLEMVHLKGWNTSNVKDMDSMFQGCTNLKILDLSRWNTGNVESMCEMFYKCSSLTNLNLSSLETNNVTTMDSMFTGCSSLTYLDLSDFDTTNVTTMAAMFSGCSSLKELTLSKYNTNKVTKMSGMFKDCSSLVSLDLSDWENLIVEDMSNMFGGCKSLTSINFTNFKTGKVKSMKGMFWGCFSLTNLDLSSFNTENVTTMSGMFESCTKLRTVDLSSFETSDVTSFDTMFYYCFELTSLDLSSFDTSNVTSMGRMFVSCRNMTAIYVSDLWDMTNVLNSTAMFQGCTSLVGGVGTTYNSNIIDGTYARVDKAEQPGYFTLKTV